MGSEQPVAATEPTQYGFSYEYGVDIKISNEWKPIRFISSVNPTVSPKEVDAATYDDNGADHPVRVGETPSLSFYVQMHRMASGKFFPRNSSNCKRSSLEIAGSVSVNTSISSPF